MSTDKSSYDGDRLPAGCPIEHFTIEEGDSNVSGKVIDVHKIAARDADWDAIQNSDKKVMAQRIVSLEKKVGEAGSDPSQATYTTIPKSSAIPAYPNAAGSTTQVIKKGDVLVSVPVDGVTHFSPGATHATSLTKLDRSMQLIENAIGTTVDSDNISTSLDAFNGTHNFGTTVRGVPRPFHYPSNATINEAIARMDSIIKDKMLDYDTALGIGLTTMYVSELGAGDKDGRDAANAMAGANVFGNTGQANRTSSGIIWEIVALSDMSAFDLISEMGNTIKLKLNSNTTFASVTIFAHSGLYCNENFSVTCSTFNCTDTSFIWIRGNVTQTSTAGNTFVVNTGSFVNISGNLTLSTSTMQVVHGSNMFVLLAISGPGRVFVASNSTLTCEALTSHTTSTALTNITVTQSSTLICTSITTTGVTSATITSIGVDDGSRILCATDITSYNQVSIHQQSSVEVRTVTVQNSKQFRVSRHSEVLLLTGGGLTAGGLVVFSHSSITEQSQVNITTSGDISITQKSSVVVTGTVTSSFGVIVVNSSSLIGTCNVRTKNFSVLHTSEYFGEDTTVTAPIITCEGNSAFYASNIIFGQFGGQTSPPIVKVDNNSVMIVSLMTTLNTLMYTTSRPLIEVRSQSRFQADDWSNSVGVVYFGLSGNSSASCANIGTTDTNNLPVGGMDVRFNLSTMSNVTLSGHWYLSGTVLHNSNMLIHDGSVIKTNDFDGLVDPLNFAQGSTLINGQGGYINGNAQGGTGNVAEFAFSADSRIV